MARVSFTFKKGPVTDHTSGGSALQDVLIGDDDSALKGDGYVSSPTSIVSSRSSFFSAQVIDYGHVFLKWGIGTTLSTPVDATPVATQVVVRWDTLGEPQTVANGQNVTTIDSTRINESLDHFVGLDGTWVYYSLFVKYEGVGVRSWYEKVASLHVLTPTRYGSTDMMWRRIARHWRLNDNELGEGILNQSSELFGYGELYRMLDIFGFDIDRIRTLIHHQMVTKDPQLATTEALDELAYELGLSMRSVDLGTERLRNIINDIGYLRQFKGTVSGVREWLTAISGSDVEVRPTHTNYLTSTQKTLDGTITNTTNASLTPTGNTWVFESTTATATATANGVTITRTGSNYELVVAKTAVTNVKNSSLYTAFLDSFSNTDVNIFAANMSPTLLGRSYAFTNASTGWGALPDNVGEIITKGNNCYQTPVSLGMVGDGTYTTTTMYLHVYMMMGPSSSISLNNIVVENNDMAPYAIDIFSQRANLVRDPQFTHMDATQWTATGASTTGRGTKTYYATTSASSASVTVATTNTIPTRTGIPYYFSVDDMYDNIEEVTLVSTVYGTLTTGELFREITYSDGSKRKIWKLLREYKNPWLPLNITDVKLKMTAITGADKRMEIRAPLLEYNNASGVYFDGDSVQGGWLSSPTLGVGIADYRWGAAGKSDAFSYYTSDYQRTIAALKRELPYIIPVTETDDPTDILNFNRIYGYTGATLL